MLTQNISCNIILYYKLQNFFWSIKLLCVRGKPMINKANIISAIMFVLLLITQYAHGESFECAFIQEKYSSGKSNQASCSMLPEKVYSTKWHTPRKNEHCEVKAVYSLFDDLTDVIVNTDKKSVIWTNHLGIIDDAKTKQKANYIKQGMSEDKADKKVNFEKKDMEYFKIVTHYKSNTRIYFDEVTGKAFHPPKEVPEHTLILSNKHSLFYLYIPEASGHAILLAPRGEADSSWINIRFGKCRKIK